MQNKYLYKNNLLFKQITGDTNILLFYMNFLKIFEMLIVYYIHCLTITDLSVIIYNYFISSESTVLYGEIIPDGMRLS